VKDDAGSSAGGVVPCDDGDGEGEEDDDEPESPIEIPDDEVWKGSEMLGHSNSHLIWKHEEAGAVEREPLGLEESLPVTQ
jgi:hypothetical protein